MFPILVSSSSRNKQASLLSPRLPSNDATSLHSGISSRGRASTCTVVELHRVEHGKGVVMSPHFCAL